MILKAATITCVVSALAVLTTSTLPAKSLLVAPSVVRQQQEIRETLINTGSQPRLAVQEFSVSGGDAETQAAAKLIAEVLWNDLEFEEEFYLIPRDAAAKIPVANSIDTIPYDQWSQLGADAVIVGVVRPVPEGLQVNIVLIGTRGDLAKKQLFGSEYKGCTVKNPRWCAHSIADDFHKRTRSLNGVARTKLAFSSDRDSQRMQGRYGESAGKEIYISDYDGANQMRVSVNRSLNISPAWGPDGRLLSYTSYATNFPDIYVQNLFEPRPPMRPAGGTDVVQNMLATWSPDGTKLAFASNRTGNWEVWIVNGNGTGLRQLTSSPATDSAPTWSPTGTQIAFTSDRTGSNQIWVVGVDGTGLVRLTSDTHCDRPTWSPAPYNDIAYTSGGGPGHDISVVDVATGRVSVLTDGLGSNEGPTFAPNGRHIAFITTRWGKKQIAIVDRKGKVQRKVTDIGNNEYPNWSRAAGGGQ